MADSANLNYPPAFLEAVAGVLHDEGGYVCNPSDPGGETKFGISKRSYPALDIKNLTRDDAIAIYFRDWWEKFHLSDLPPRIAAKVFNIGVNTYIPPAIVCLQRALRACGAHVEEDGVLGIPTIAAAKALCSPIPGGPPANPDALLAAMRSEFAAHYRLIAQHQKRTDIFISGWLNRAYAP